MQPTEKQIGLNSTRALPTTMNISNSTSIVNFIPNMNKLSKGYEHDVDGYGYVHFMTGTNFAVMKFGLLKS